MEFNDGSMYRVVSNPGAQLAERQVYMHRAASARAGVPYVDPTFAAHRSALARMPLLVFYQFVYTNAGSPEAQAEFFCNAIGELRPNEAVMVDPEAGGGFTESNAEAWVARWLKVTEARLGCRAWVYVPGALAAGLSREVTEDRIVMAPRYSGTAARGAQPSWPWDVHQYTDRGRFPGCAQSGDTSYTPLTVAALASRSRPKEAPPLMATSYNGWSAGSGWSVSGGQLEKLVVAGEPFSPGVRAGDVHDVLEYVANQLHKRVEPVDKGHSADDWGYSYRANRNNPSQLSCHASGTAIDYNATRHPNGRGGTWTTAQRNEINQILGEVNNVVRCLFGYDEMHFEIKGTASQVKAAADKVRGKAAAAKQPSTRVKAVQLAVNLTGADADGYWGPQTDQRVRIVRAATKGEFPSGEKAAQVCVGTNPDGDWGPLSEAATVQTVRELQAAFGQIDVDGDWGPATEARWKECQSYYGIGL